MAIFNCTSKPAQPKSARYSYVSTGEFYPPIEPFEIVRFPVGHGHELYVERSGNPNGVPVVVLHGGPGAGISAGLRQFFNPALYHIIMFDQRGAGKSTPLAGLAHNTTWDLVRDIEKIRRSLKIKNWHVFGGSWGSTLALAYAIEHPNRVRSMTLRGIFMGRASEIDWIFKWGASMVFPDHWEKFLALLTPEERADPVAAYHKMLTGKDVRVRQKAATAWAKWETCLTSIHVNEQALNRFNEPANALPFSCIECHYFINGCFLPTPNWIFENIDRIRHIPTVLVQGRYDMNCPIATAWELKNAWSECQLIVAAEGPHTAGDPNIRRLLINATDTFARLA